MSQRLFATLVTTVALTGSIRHTERLSAQLTTALPVAGTTVNSQRLTAQLSTSVVLEGTVRGSQRLSSSLDTFAALEGTARQSSRVVGTITTSVALSGVVRGSERLTGSIGTAIPLSGVVCNTQRLVGSVTGDTPLAGTVRTTQRLTGGLVHSVALLGVSRNAQRLSGQLSTLVSVQGTIRQTTRLQSNINFNTALALQGAIRQYARLYAALTSYELAGPYDNELVDTQVDIEDPKAVIPIGLSSTARPGALTFDYKLAYTLGPEAIGTADTGILNWAWYVTVDGSSVKYARSNNAYDGWQTEAELFDYVGDYITEIDCAFEQNGRIVVVAERPTGPDGTAEVWLYWYKPSLAAFTFERIDAGRSPRVVLDNPNDTTIADVHIAYVKDGSGLITRRQSELYATARSTVFTAWSGWYLEEFARNRGNRLVAILSGRVGDRYYLDRVESTLFPAYPRDGVTLGARGLVTSSLADELLYFLTDPDSASLSPSALTSSTLADVLITHTLYDKDSAELVPSALTSSSLVVVLLEWLYTDWDSIELVPDVRTTSALDVVLIQDDLAFGEDNVELTVTVRNTSTLEVP